MARMYFGTRERMTWVKCPAFNADISKAAWSTEGVYLSGGAYVRRSATSHKRFRFDWNLASGEEIRQVLDYADGVYGSDLIYFLDPFAMSTNLLPQYWATPRLGNEDAPTFVKNQRPSLTATTTNSLSYPTRSAVYEFKAGSEFASLFIPVPEGYTFYFGAHGSSTGTAGIILTAESRLSSAFVETAPGSGLYSPGSGMTEVSPGVYTIPVGMVEDPPGSGLYTSLDLNPTQGVNLLPVSSTTRFNAGITNVSGVTISFAGEGILTLAGMMVQVLPNGTTPQAGGFISGQGHSGCRIPPSTVTVAGYSSRLDKQSASVVLVETGAWE